MLSIQPKLIAIMLLAVFVSSCAFVPEVSSTQHYSANCKMFTKKLMLTTIRADGVGCAGHGQANAEACLLIYGIIVPAGSFVISGGIVLTTNTLHWLEYQGSCDDGVILKSVEKLKNTFNKS
ncbi:MAG: hypothetical protein JKX83_08270 [Pseudomonadales bacterium]|nr:hypothetical protein [Pseudomonadales bacterium]